MSTTEKTAYEAPKLERIGSLEDVTQGNSNGNFTDKTFPVDTPKASLTFS